MRRALLAGVIAWLVLAASVNAIRVGRATLTTAPTLIFIANRGGSEVLIRNTGTVSIFLGPATVDAATGFEVLAGDAVTASLEQSEDRVYGVVASGSAVVHWMESRR